MAKKKKKETKPQMATFLNNYGEVITVNRIKREPNDLFDELETQELKNLVKHKYLIKI